MAYANVRDVTHSQLRQRFREMESTQEHQNQFEEKTGRFQAARLEALALAHGATVADYQGKRLITHHDADRHDTKHDDMAVGRFDAIAGQAGLPTEIASQMPAISWFSAAGHINGGVSAVLKAETKDEASAQNLRDVLKGLLALAKMQAGSKPGMQQLADSLALSGEGKNVALSFSVPSEVLDVLEGLAKGRKGL